MKTMVLFSGGKDSFYSLLKTVERGPVDCVVSIRSQVGDTQLHAGPEVDKQIQNVQLDLLGLPSQEMIVGSSEDYLHKLFILLSSLVQERGITHLVTGDLWHPYTSGIGDMLAAALGVTLVRPAREACQFKEAGDQYMREILSEGIKSVIVSVRQGDLPEYFVGRMIDEGLLRELGSINVDVAAEGGEYQSFVLAGPSMEGRIVIDNFSIELVEGKNGREKFHRMRVEKYHLES